METFTFVWKSGPRNKRYRLGSFESRDYWRYLPVTDSLNEANIRTLHYTDLYDSGYHDNGYWNKFFVSEEMISNNVSYSDLYLYQKKIKNLIANYHGRYY